MTEPSAKVVADSYGPHGIRLTTMEVTFHRFVLAEFNTHRMFSRNSASSRAIPVRKQIDRVENDLAFPLLWPKEQKGMQGGEELSADDEAFARSVWMKARDAATTWSWLLSQLGVHKSVVNRLLEPFMWHTAIVSSTEWDNFWRQRCSPLAQPELRAAAEAMKIAYATSQPKFVDFDEWHLPYVQEDERDEYPVDVLAKISAARCARVSYLTHDGIRDTDKDLELFERLVTAEPPHASPLEHVATPRIPDGLPGNFYGWKQLRHELLKF